MPRSTKQLEAEIAEALANDERKKRCAYCGKPTRKGSLVLDEGQTAHRACFKEFEEIH
jgi:hypothetical protein